MSNNSSAAPKTLPRTLPTIVPVGVPSSASELALSASELFVGIIELVDWVVDADDDDDDWSVLDEDELLMRPEGSLC